MFSNITVKAISDSISMCPNLSLIWAACPAITIIEPSFALAVDKIRPLAAVT